ncbi:hypothetical protein [Arthrobacter sp. ERGS1:01]|uniref:hypothetical protein n=1 Tax=Arthrobacter sp. ERGS1:01 TaxID=1704044 RepID=UPI00123708E3|nr:hypothetical protein [Arthrobacter sp. ERGS1:01]
MMDVATLGVLVGLVVLATGSTVWLVKSRPARERDPDTKFWYGFAGVCVLLPAILITTAANSWAGALLAVLAAGTWFWAGMLTSRHLAAQSSIREHARAAGEHAALAARHNAVLARWSRYELDPAAAIDFPAMTDVRCPETSALAKAVALAAALRGDTRDSETASAIAEYREAVALLESVFALAEQAATDPAPGSLNRR